MPPVPVLRPLEVIRAFEKLGWQVTRQQGSHIILIKEGHPARSLCLSMIGGSTRHIAEPN